MKKILLYLAILSILVSCGVKKPAAQQGQQEPQTTTEPVVINDSLSFLGDLINDSTIHINYVYGIPFIIDDSVPMLLPPIDKNPQGYVSNKNYEYMALNRGEKVSVCGKMNPLDSLLWLNKCVNDLLSFKDSSWLPVSHYYSYSLSLYSFDDETGVFMFGVSFSPYWSCIEDVTPKKYRGVCYVFDCEGNTLGKMNVTKPVDWKLTTPVGEWDKLLPEAENVFTLLKQKSKRKMLLPLSFIKYDPNYECKN